MYFACRGSPMSSSIPMTWNQQKYLTPSPEPFTSDSLATDKVAYYATPPLSPTASQGSSTDYYPAKDNMGMPGSGMRQLDQPSYPGLRGYGYNSNQRYLQTTDQSHSQSLVSSAQPSATALYSSYGQIQSHHQHQSQSHSYNNTPHLQDNLTQYEPEFTPVSQRQTQWPALSTSLVYNVTSSSSAGLTPSQQSSDYASVPHPYTSPQSATAIEVLANQFSGDTSHYYNPAAESTSAQGFALPSNVHPRYPISSYNQEHQPSFHHLATAATLSSHRSPTSYHTQQGIEDFSMANTNANTSAVSIYVDNNYQAFRDSLQRIFRYIQGDRLIEAGRILTELSLWLKDRLDDFGLIQDDKARHKEHLELWENFNHCWLALLQKQKDHTRQAVQNKDRSTSPSGLLTLDTLNSMGTDIIKLCDALESHGLVDYELGVWEEEIISILMACIEIRDGAPSGSSSSIKLRSKSSRS